MTAEAAVGPQPRTLPDPLDEALRVVHLADERKLLVRLMGGMAIRAHAPEWPARTRRVEVDLDFATRSRDRSAFYELLADEGYTPDKRHNALFGGTQAYFVDVPRNRPVDVLDALVLLAEHPLGTNDGAPDSRHGLGAINVPRILSFTSNDWGWWRTVTGNLHTLDQYLAADLTPEDLDLNNGRTILFQPAAQIADLRTAIDEAPKSTRWRLRAKVGERASWYQDPEEMGHGGM